MERKKNPNCWFAAATMKHVEELAVLMGKNNVAIIGKDDPVILPDHTFVVSTKHKLIPSVYATRQIKEDGLT